MKYAATILVFLAGSSLFVSRINGGTFEACWNTFKGAIAECDAIRPGLPLRSPQDITQCYEQELAQLKVCLSTATDPIDLPTTDPLDVQEARCRSIFEADKAYCEDTYKRRRGPAPLYPDLNQEKRKACIDGAYARLNACHTKVQPPPVAPKVEVRGIVASSPISALSVPVTFEVDLLASEAWQLDLSMSIDGDTTWHTVSAYQGLTYNVSLVSGQFDGTVNFGADIPSSLLVGGPDDIIVSAVFTTSSDSAFQSRVIFGVQLEWPVGDANRDLQIDHSDVVLVSGLLGLDSDDAGFNHKADLNFDGSIDLDDIAVILSIAPSALRCSPADIAYDDGTLLPPLGPIPTTANGLANNGITEADYNMFFAAFFEAEAAADIANDDGSPLPPFGPLGSNNAVTEGDYNLFFATFFNGCP